MGIADYGVSPSGSYEYSSNKSLGQVTIISLHTQNSTGDPWMGFQLNVNLVFHASDREYVYWVQDVAQVDTSSNQIYFLDNVWNSSSPTSSMSASGISGNGQVAFSSGTGFYYDFATLSLSGNGISLSYPASVSFLVSCDVNSLGQPFVTFEYDDGSGIVAYDTTTFTSSSHLTSLAGFEVNGNQYNPRGVFFDSELILGGPGNGQTTTDIQSDVLLALYYWNSHNYQSVPNAYNFGSDTAETAGNARSEWHHIISTGSLIAEVHAGTGTLGKLYDESEIGIIDVKSSFGSGVLYVSNATDTLAIPDQYAYVGGEVAVALYPGAYLIQIYNNGALVDQGTETVGAGQSLHLTTPLGDIQVKMSYAILGGGTGFSPTLTYVHGGAQATAYLTTTPTTYFMDPGTTWSVTGNQTGSTERWITNRPTSGVASTFQAIQLTYFHQYLVTFAYSVTGGGQAKSGPVAQYDQFGTTKSTATGAPVWADVGSGFSLTNPLPGSTFSERWDSTSASNSILAAGTISVTYYFQFPVAVSYSIVGGGTPTLPSASGTEFGSPFTTQLASQNSTVWFDSGTNWNLTNPLVGSTSQERWQSPDTVSGSMANAWSISVLYLHQYALKLSSSIIGGGNPAPPSFSARQFGQPFAVTFAVPIKDFFDAGSSWTVPVQLGAGTSNERWITLQPVSGVVAGSSTIQMTYNHQFYMNETFGPASGGSIANSTGWYNSGTTVELNATANSGWKFEGWTGSGNGAYSGPLSQASLQANGPIVENATFYPGLEITSGANGGVSYNYGSQSGTVAAGTSQTVYAPIGTVFSLNANPSSLFFKSDGWSPSAAGPSGMATVRLGGPSSINASFSLNVVDLGGIVGAVVAVAVVGVYAFRRTKKPATP